MICDLFNDFFTDYRIIPKKSMSISEQINCVIKILMLLFILCLLSDLNMEVYIILLFIIISRFGILLFLFNKSILYCNIFMLLIF